MEENGKSVCSVCVRRQIRKRSWLTADERNLSWWLATATPRLKSSPFWDSGRSCWADELFSRDKAVNSASAGNQWSAELECWKCHSDSINTSKFGEEREEKEIKLDSTDRTRERWSNNERKRTISIFIETRRTLWRNTISIDYNYYTVRLEIRSNIPSLWTQSSKVFNDTIFWLK